jgi:hypothetical protein
LDKTVFGQNSFWTKQFLDKTVFGQNSFWTKQFLDKTVFGQNKKFFGKKFSDKISFGQTIVAMNCGQKMIQRLQTKMYPIAVPA